MEERKKFRLADVVLSVICVVFVAEAAAPVASIGNSQYFWWVFMMIRPLWACRKIFVSLTTAAQPESMTSRSTLPGPTEGSWSMSPTKMRRILGGTAFSREFSKTASIMDHSSRIKASPSSGLSSFR